MTLFNFKLIHNSTQQNRTEILILFLTDSNAGLAVITVSTEDFLIPQHG